jgi:hypothetical protein
MERTWKPTVAGILAIIAGTLQVILGMLGATGVGFWAGFFGLGWLSVIFAPLIIFGIVAIIGGIYALRREVWGLALAGSICAFIPVIAPWSILGVLAIIFVSLGKGEFK